MDVLPDDAQFPGAYAREYACDFLWRCARLEANENHAIAKGRLRL
jgi:hypothetical protein